MRPEEKIYKVLEKIKAKLDIAPVGAVIDYRAGYEVGGIMTEDEILILNKLAEEGAFDVLGNYSNEYM